VDVSFGGGRRSCRFVGGGKALALEFPFVLLVFHVVVGSVCSLMNPIVSPAIHKNHNTNLSYYRPASSRSGWSYWSGIRQL